jgi:hypothetical protein
MRSCVVWSLVGLVSSVIQAAPAAAAPDCAGLASLKIENTNLLSATEVPAAGDLPAYCRVLGFVRPAINFEIRLPVERWNGKFYEAGCGGFCGTLNSDAPGFTNAMNFGLRRGYAAATMDSGHWGTSVLDGRWAMNNPVAQMDWGQRAATETARVSKLVLRSYYGRPQSKAYFAGCSTGGRMAAMEALRFPSDFDGIVSGAPALDYTGLVATFFAWTTQANRGPDGKPIFPTAKVKLVQDAVAAACGDKAAPTGLVADPRRCAFKPAALQCSAAANGADCLTEAEIGVLDKWYSGPKDKVGRQLFPGGIPMGSEAHWPRWLTGAGNASALMPLFGQDFIRYMAFQPSAGPGASIADYDVERDPPRLAAMAPVYNAATFDPASGTANPAADLSAFARAGGKMLLYHGWADSLVTPEMTVAFYDALAKKAGGTAQLQETARLFMVPGMDHCGISTEGPGISDTGIDPLTALERWVEQGEAPAQLMATKAGAPGAKPAWSRPVCAYPRVARYSGTGDATEAANFTCAEP